MYDTKHTRRKPVVAFDVDGCLLDENDEPRYEILALLMGLVPWCRVVVWSGGGVSYAKLRGRELGLPSAVVYWSKARMPGSVDIAFDDQEVTLGVVNIQVADTAMEPRVVPAAPAEEEADAIARWETNGGP